MAEKKSEVVVKDIKRRTRRKYTAEEKISIVLEGLRGKTSSAMYITLCKVASLFGKSQEATLYCTGGGIIEETGQEWAP